MKKLAGFKFVRGALFAHALPVDAADADFMADGGGVAAGLYVSPLPDFFDSFFCVYSALLCLCGGLRFLM